MAAKITKILASYGGVIISRTLRIQTKEVLFSGTRLRTISQLQLQRPEFLWWQTKRMATTDTEAGVSEVKAERAVEEESAILKQDTGDVLPVEKSEPKADGENDPAPNSNTKQEPEQKKQFTRKFKCAILLSYSGQGYYGMQMQNNGIKTIENDLMKAFLDAGMVDEVGFSKPKSLHFQRAARTDKNVSAAKNIISIMMPKDFDPDAVNQHLPDQIRVMDFRRVTKGFDSKNMCNARTYLYMIPTFAFAPIEVNVQEEYRMIPEILEKLRETLNLYVGTKNYHNFTSRKKATDPSAMRFIMTFTSSDPFVKDGLEYVVLKVKGQSFMMHQIRKMIGLTIAILRGYATKETLEKCFAKDRIDIPMAPGLGLMLGEVHYDNYNNKFGKDGIHEPLLWDNVTDKVEQFCQDQIYTNVTRTELEEKSMFNWLTTIPLHTYDTREQDDRKGYGPLGSAHLNVKRVNGEASDDGEDDECDSDDELPKKKQKRS